MIDLSLNALAEDKIEDLLVSIEDKLNADILYLSGPMMGNLERVFLNRIESLKDDGAKHNLERDAIYIILTTEGGSAEVVERLVNILRHNYSIVNFIVPDYAYSAGTIFCMSGNKIYMDYFSVLGPIDPQVETKEGKLVAALGYLDKVEELIKKANEGTLSDAEFVILKEFNLAELKSFEQAKDLTIDLLKKWLAKYKFEDWQIHKSTGLPVSVEDKEHRAEEIADALSDHHIWKSHGRPLSINELRSLKLQIDDYSEDKELHMAIRELYSYCTDLLETNGVGSYIRIRRSCDVSN
jgi:hypothetical protein